MTRLASRLTWRHNAPQEHLAVNAAGRERPAMDHIGIDVHKRKSQIYILAEGGEVVEQRIRTEPERLAALLGTRPRARILIEASTDSEWVARCLEALGHEVIVADPNFAPMYATRSRKVKTDRRDARALAEACRLGAYRPAHRLSNAQRHVRGRLLSAVAPLLALLCPLNRQLAYSDATIEHLAAHGPRVLRLRSVPCVGPVTAAAFLAAIDDAQRFRHAHQLEAYLGLVPRSTARARPSAGARSPRPAPRAPAGS
jgi:transposase